MVDLNEKIKLPNKPLFEYFNSNPPRLWDFESFRKSKTSQAVHPPRNKRITANYKKTIQHIADLPYISSEIKDHLDTLLNPKSDKENSPVVNQYINYGNVGLQGSNNDNVNVHMHTIKRIRYNNEEEDHSGGDNVSNDDDCTDVDSSQLGSTSHVEEVEVEEHDSFLTDRTDCTYQTEDSNFYAEVLTTRKYIMTMNEVNMNESNTQEEYNYDCSSSLSERLAISAINENMILPEIYELTPTPLDCQEYSRIKEWRMKVKKNQLYYPPVASTPGQLHLNTFLCNMMDTIINEKQNPHKKSEIGFTIDNISPLLKYLFPANGVLSFRWEKSSMLSTSTASKGVRTDFIILANDQEVGCGEIKSLNTTPHLVNEDRARIAETIKRQLHSRIMKSKDPKEFVTFGMVFNGFDIELYIMTFDAESTSPYQFYKIDILKLPSSPISYTTIEESIENLLSFKTSIISSLAEDADILKPYIYHDYIDFFQPTLAFVKA